MVLSLAKFSFLWTQSNGRLSVFPATGKNEYFMIGENDFIAVGCGEGNFGIWLDSDLFKGTSGNVPTFDNIILSTNTNFECTGIEIWEIATE